VPKAYESQTHKGRFGALCPSSAPSTDSRRHAHLLMRDAAGVSAIKKPRRSGASSVPDGTVAYFFFECFWLPLR
jgi:hypothetical protein